MGWDHAKKLKKVNGAKPPFTYQSKDIVIRPFIPPLPGFDEDVFGTHFVLLGRWDIPHGDTSVRRMPVCSRL